MKNMKRNENRIKTSTDEKIINIVCYILFTLITLVCFYPFYYLLICTISDSNLVEYGKIILIPKGINFDNYKDILELSNLGRAALVSLLRTVLGTLLSLLVTSYMAYFFTKGQMWGRKFWYRFCVVTMYFSAGLIPQYLTRKMLGLNDSFWVYILPTCVSAYNMILVKTSIENMPPSLEESAYLDGAGYFTRFVKIVLPLQKPILATIALFSAVGHWNDFLTTKIYITSPELYTLQFLLHEMMNRINTVLEEMQYVNPTANFSPTGVRMTLTLVIVLPIICVYPFIQKYYVKGIMIGAVKG